MRSPHTESPFNKLPPVVVVLALAIFGVEAVLQLGERGLLGGREAVGWRLELVQLFAVNSRMLDLVQLTGFEDSYPSQLSGGMRKRVGLAQTLVYDPETILLDEPFGALDAMLKLGLQAELMAMIDAEETSVRNVLLVTHDLDEAVTLADRVVVMSARPGRIKAEVPIVLERPRDPKTIRDTPEFQEARRTVWAELQDEIVIE